MKTTQLGSHRDIEGEFALRGKEQDGSYTIKRKIDGEWRLWRDFVFISAEEAQMFCDQANATNNK
jgi:hypothetical protein